MAIPQKIKRLVLERDGHRCVLQLAWCQLVATDADHRANRGHGGARSLDRPSNLIAACRRCNGAKADATEEVLAELERRGARVIGASTHAKTAARSLATPVTYPDGTKWLLDDNGGKERVT